MAKQPQKTSDDMDFDIDSLGAVDTAELRIKSRDGTPTPWVWIIAGPGHPKTIELNDRVTAEMRARQKAQEAARVNGKKWKGDNETVEEARRRNIGNMADRVLGWTPENVKLAGEPYPFSRENVVRILMDPERGDTIIAQLGDFFDDERSFMKRSETT